MNIIKKWSQIDSEETKKNILIKKNEKLIFDLYDSESHSKGIKIINKGIIEINRINDPENNYFELDIINFSSLIINCDLDLGENNEIENNGELIINAKLDIDNDISSNAKLSNNKTIMINKKLFISGYNGLIFNNNKNGIIIVNSGGELEITNKFLFKNEGNLFYYNDSIIDTAGNKVNQYYLLLLEDINNKFNIEIKNNNCLFIKKGENLKITNRMNLKMELGSKILNQGTIINESTITCKGGYIDNQGVINNKKDIIIKSNAKLNNNNELTNKGTIKIKGEMKNSSNLFNKKDIIITNNGEIYNVNNLINKGTIEINDKGRLINFKKLLNQGTLINNSELWNWDLIENETINFENYGNIDNGGIIYLKKNTKNLGNLKKDNVFYKIDLDEVKFNTYIIEKGEELILDNNNFKILDQQILINKGQITINSNSTFRIFGKLINLGNIIIKRGADFSNLGIVENKSNILNYNSLDDLNITGNPIKKNIRHYNVHYDDYANDLFSKHVTDEKKEKTKNENLYLTDFYNKLIGNTQIKYLLNGHGSTLINEYVFLPENINIIFTVLNSASDYASTNTTKIHGFEYYSKDKNELEQIIEESLLYDRARIYPANFIVPNLSIDLNLTYKSGKIGYSGLIPEKYYNRNDEIKPDKNIDNLLKFSDFKEELVQLGDNINLLKIINLLKSKYSDKKILLYVSTCRGCDTIKLNPICSANPQINFMNQYQDSMQRVFSTSYNVSSENLRLKERYSSYVSEIKGKERNNFTYINDFIEGKKTLSLDEICKFLNIIN